MSKRALLLVNLGTPDSTDVADVRRYLREFLGDPDVISMPAPLRFLLLEGVILRTRPKKSAEAYRKVWTDRGSPLMWHSLDLVDKVREKVAAGTRVVFPAPGGASITKLGVLPSEATIWPASTMARMRMPLVVPQSTSVMIESCATSTRRRVR